MCRMYAEVRREIGKQRQRCRSGGRPNWTTACPPEAVLQEESEQRGRVQRPGITTVTAAGDSGPMLGGGAPLWLGLAAASVDSVPGTLATSSGPMAAAQSARRGQWRQADNRGAVGNDPDDVGAPARTPPHTTSNSVQPRDAVPRLELHREPVNRSNSDNGSVAPPEPRRQ
jgi:hypothetical protein